MNQRVLSQRALLGVIGVTLTSLALLLMLSSSASAAAPDPANANGNKIQCFDGTTDGGFNGVCTLTANGATLNTVDADADPNNAYAGVYLQNSNLAGKTLSTVNKIAFSYSGTGAVGGSPRISVPIDLDGDGAWDQFLFADTGACNDGDANVGTLDLVNDPTCTMYLGGVTPYANWAEFVAANPTARIATDTVSFIIVDQPGEFEITNVQLGKGPAKPVK
jgi:hypothetical protein